MKPGGLPPADADEVPGTVEGSGLSPVTAMHLVLEVAAATAAAGDWKGILDGLEAGLRGLFGADEIVLALADGDGGGFVVRRARIGTGSGVRCRAISKALRASWFRFC